MSLIDKLLQMDKAKFTQLLTREVELTRLTEAFGEPSKVKCKAIDGVVEPSLKDQRLLAYFGCVTPKELVKKLFLAGEIAELSNVITVLSGYDKEGDEERPSKDRKQY